MRVSTARRGGRTGWVRRNLLLCAAMVVVPGFAADATHAHAAGGFVSRSGTQLTLNGSPWHPIGWNNYRLTNSSGGFVCDPLRGVLDDQQMQALFTRFRTESGANVIRTWFFQSYLQPASAQPYAAFDRVLANAAASGVLVIPVLTNNYADCESATATRKTLAWYQTGYMTPSDPSYGYTVSFQQYATAMAQHYAANTTIAFWQLVNEIDPSGCTSADAATAASAIHDFGNTMATTLKAVDGNHLVSLGTQGSGQCGTDGANYVTVHANSAIDMCEYHDYHEPNRGMPTGDPSSAVDSGNGLQTRITQCNSLTKPLIVGESGILADVAANGTSTGTVTAATLQQRSSDFSAKLQAAFAAGADGYLIWEGIPEASDSAANFNDGDYGIGPQDPSEAAMLAVARTENPAASTNMAEALAVLALPLLGMIVLLSTLARRRWLAHPRSAAA